MRAKLIAALRSMPDVCAVLASSRFPHAIVLPAWWRGAGTELMRPSIEMFVPVAGMLLWAHVFFNPIFIIHSLEVIISSYTVLYKSVRHVFGYFSYSFQARTVTRNNEFRLQLFEFINRSGNYWLKYSTC